MSSEVITFCPLGVDGCETKKEGKIHRCEWYKDVLVQDLNTKKEYYKWGCALAWTPFLLSQIIYANRSHAAATEDYRNSQEKTNEALKESLNNNRIIALTVAKQQKELSQPKKVELIENG